MQKNKFYLSLALGALFIITLLWLFIRAFSTPSLIPKTIYHIARDSTWYPIDLRGKEKAMAGFTDDLIEEVGKLRGFRAITFEVGPNALFDGLNLGNYDAVLSSLPPTVMNRTQYEFSTPFYLLGPVLIVRKNSKIRGFDDLTEGKILGLASGTLQQYNISEPAGVVIIPYDSSKTAMEKLDQNIIDGVLMDALSAYVWTEGFYTGKMIVITNPLTNKGLRLITRNTPKNHLFVEEFNAGLKELKANDGFRKLLIKWDLFDTELH